MPKRGKSQGLEVFFSNDYWGILLAGKFWWEFVRRNENYCKFWRGGLRAKKKPKAWDKRFNPNLTYDQLIVKLTKEVKLTDALISESLGAKAGSIPAKYKSKWRQLITENNRLYFMQKLAGGGVRYEMDKREKCLTIRIYFDLIKSRRALRDYICAIVEERYKMHSPEEWAKKLAGKERVRWREARLTRDYDKILRIGDMKRDGKTIEQIAREEFSKETPESKREVRRYLKEYETFVNGGYEDIAFP